jgi:multiple RNA-binding domain-containing protein 1
MTRHNKGFAFVAFLMPSDAQRAFESLDRTSFQGRVLHLLPAKEKESDQATGFTSSAKSSYKKEKEAQMKKNAGSGKNWNTLFINQKALEGIIATKYGVSREQLLMNNFDESEDPRKRLETPAVRMAMAETQVVQDVEDFLKNNGVCLDAFDELANADNDQRKKAIKRSTTTILVRNLTEDISEAEIRERFVKYGVLEKVLLPPFGVTGKYSILEIRMCHRLIQYIWSIDVAYLYCSNR